MPWDGKKGAGGINAFFHNITFGKKTIKSFNTIGTNRFYGVSQISTEGKDVIGAVWIVSQ